MWPRPKGEPGLKLAGVTEQVTTAEPKAQEPQVHAYMAKGLGGRGRGKARLEPGGKQEGRGRGEG
jgi:hypothetical protein